MKIAGAALLFVSLVSCGYHVSGKADLLPKTVHTIAITSFGNNTSRYKLSQTLTSSLTREFISRTRYRIVADPGEADAVLTGAVTNIFTAATVYDPVKARASAAEVIVIMQVTLTNRDGSVLFSRPSYEVRERYEISTDPKTYFEESDAAMDRLSRDVARSVVSAILENF